MTDQNPRAVIGSNNPPDPIDTINARFEADRLESENWLDGSPVENEPQMLAIDALRKAMREWRMELEAGQKSATAPLHDAYKAELARWKPTIEDAQRFEKGLVSAVDGFKRRLAAEKADAERRAREKAEVASRAARAAAIAADVSNIDAQREAARLQSEAEAAMRAAAAASKDTVKGLRTVTRYEVIDPVKLARWLWANDHEAQIAAQADRARVLGLHLPGIFEQRKERIAS